LDKFGAVGVKVDVYLWDCRPCVMPLGFQRLHNVTF